MKNNKAFTKLLHDRNFTKFGLNINLPTVFTALFILIIMIGFVVINRDNATETIASLSQSVLSVFALPLLLLLLLSFVFVIVISISPLGKLKLGGKDVKPEFKNMSWYAMLFGSGMGIGFMFWGVAEPLSHMNNTPLFQSDDPAISALSTTLFHWGLFPWALYALVALALAYFSYNHKLPLAPRSLFYPILKNKIFGFTGHVIDGVCVLLTLFSLASSLGFGALQVNAGFNYLLNIDMSVTFQVILIIVVTAIATISLVSGVDKGIKLLSEFNLYLAAFLALVFLTLGPTLLIIGNMFSSTGLYLQKIFSSSVNITQHINEPSMLSWASAWTLFYWAWWVGWAIFVGIFIAKISIGRSVRELLLSVTIIPSIIAVLWFGIFGTNAIHFNELTNNGLLDIINKDVALSLYALIDSMNLNDIFTILLYIISIILIISFFVTSSDSGSMVVDNLTSAGSEHNPVTQKIFWASLEGLVAISLIILGGENILNTIQNVLIIVAGPLCIIFFVSYYCIIHQLTVDYVKERKK